MHDLNLGVTKGSTQNLAYFTYRPSGDQRPGSRGAKALADALQRHGRDLKTKFAPPRSQRLDAAPTTTTEVKVFTHDHDPGTTVLNENAANKITGLLLRSGRRKLNNANLIQSECFK